MTLAQIFAIAALMAGDPTTAGTAEMRTAAAFLRHLYTPYVAGDTHFEPLGQGASAIFDTQILAAIRKDQANAPRHAGN